MKLYIAVQRLINHLYIMFKINDILNANKDKWLKKTEVARMVGVHHRTVRRYYHMLRQLGAPIRETQHKMSQGARYDLKGERQFILEFNSQTIEPMMAKFRIQTEKEKLLSKRRGRKSLQDCIKPINL